MASVGLISRELRADISSFHDIHHCMFWKGNAEGIKRQSADGNALYHKFLEE